MMMMEMMMEMMMMMMTKMLPENDAFGGQVDARGESGCAGEEAKNSGAVSFFDETTLVSGQPTGKGKRKSLG